MSWFRSPFDRLHIPERATKFRVVLPVVVIGIIAASAWLAPGATPSRAAAHRKADLFGPVFNIMTRTGDEMGCLGCHISEKPGGFIWFGGDHDSVLQTFETGVTPDGEMVFDPPPVEGGRDGLLAFLLHNGFMPRYGTPWGEDELAILDAWLITYE